MPSNHDSQNSGMKDLRIRDLFMDGEGENIHLKPECTCNWVPGEGLENIDSHAAYPTRSFHNSAPGFCRTIFTRPPLTFLLPETDKDSGYNVTQLSFKCTNHDQSEARSGILEMTCEPVRCQPAHDVSGNVMVLRRISIAVAACASHASCKFNARSIRAG